ncbi:MAG: hypothetical protein HY221_02550 [Candidatus Sungbacteria bacterium]|uniref:Uncharacterized protein n=1 Tax=Candidatus Sungiibacteriota bacterium TaxID=2750080 RepID=A0A932QZ78_9BACT|nr:hypothetical protein [Candidatus Sungbacteria bacterium]
MEQSFEFDARTNVHLRFMNFSEWMNFCYYCVRENIAAATDSETLGATISRKSFQNLPTSFRDVFAVQDAETSKKILAGRKRPTRPVRNSISKRARGKRPARPAADHDQMDDKKLIDLFLPSVLMPRVD